mmetsp:Transcript_114287/g.347679  ORF Transcript_114287/g.347679 Transcript_114287/m.347679 type:complete len:113 (-) Transcript_114287:110-448(-)
MHSGLFGAQCSSGGCTRSQMLRSFETTGPLRRGRARGCNVIVLQPAHAICLRQTMRPQQAAPLDCEVLVACRSPLSSSSYRDPLTARTVIGRRGRSRLAGNCRAHRYRLSSA